MTIFVAYDCETTGLGNIHHELVEVGAVRFSSEVREIATFTSFVNPKRSIPADAIAVHGITSKMVEGAPDGISVVDDLLKFFEGADMLVAHNSNFDQGFIAKYMNQEQRRTLERFRTMDTWEIARKRWPHRPSYSLSALTRYLSLEGGYHRALGDARACRDVFMKAIT